MQTQLLKFCFQKFTSFPFLPPKISTFSTILIALLCTQESQQSNESCFITSTSQITYIFHELHWLLLLTVAATNHVVRFIRGIAHSLVS